VRHAILVRGSYTLSHRHICTPGILPFQKAHITPSMEKRLDGTFSSCGGTVQTSFQTTARARSVTFLTYHPDPPHPPLAKSPSALSSPPSIDPLFNRKNYRHRSTPHRCLSRWITAAEPRDLLLSCSCCRRQGSISLM
jgi:hypothetical protein